MICSQCEDGYTLSANSQCILDLQAMASKCASNQYIKLINGPVLYSCQSCDPDASYSCSSCHLVNVNDTTPKCDKCNDGFFLRFNQVLNAFVCESVSCDSTEQYKYALDAKGLQVKCYYCPESCAACKLDNIFDLNSLKCSSCQTGYIVGSTGLCVKSADLGDYTCEKHSQYPILQNNQITCQDCPSSCS